MRRSIDIYRRRTHGTRRLKRRGTSTFVIFVLVIVCSCFCINVAAVDTTYKVDSIDDIPRDWTGKYNGYGLKGSVYRGMDMHIANIIKL